MMKFNGEIEEPSSKLAQFLSDLRKATLCLHKISTAGTDEKLFWRANSIAKFG